VDLINLAQDMAQCWVLVNKLVNLRVPQHTRNVLTI